MFYSQILGKKSIFFTLQRLCCVNHEEILLLSFHTKANNTRVLYFASIKFSKKISIIF